MLSRFIQAYYQWRADMASEAYSRAFNRANAERAAGNFGLARQTDEETRHYLHEQLRWEAALKRKPAVRSGGLPGAMRLIPTKRTH